MMKSIEVLAERNAHPRDKKIRYDADLHAYADSRGALKSVTSWKDSHFAKFDDNQAIDSMKKGKKWKKGHRHWGMTTNEIRAAWADNRDEACDLGTKLHARIERFLNDPDLPPGYSHKDLMTRHLEHLHEDGPEELQDADWRQFLEFVCDTPHLIPYRTEWRTFHEDFRLGGTSDVLYYDPKAQEYIIYDWKRSKKFEYVNEHGRKCITPGWEYMSDTEYWKYAIQLNLYKIILMDKYGIPVGGARIVRMHPTLPTYQIIEMPHIDPILRRQLVTESERSTTN